MDVSIQCLLEQDLPDAPHMEGKSLAMACFSELGAETPDENSETADIITIDFGGGKPPPKPPSAPSPLEPLFAPLTRFIAGNAGIKWHDPKDGLAAVRSILKKLRDGATVAVASDFPFGFDDDEKLTDGVQYDLEQLEQILIPAQKAQTRFCLALDV